MHDELIRLHKIVTILGLAVIVLGLAVIFR